MKVGNHQVEQDARNHGWWYGPGGRVETTRLESKGNHFRADVVVVAESGGKTRWELGWGEVEGCQPTNPLMMGGVWKGMPAQSVVCSQRLGHGRMDPRWEREEGYGYIGKQMGNRMVGTLRLATRLARKLATSASCGACCAVERMKMMTLPTR